MKPSVQRGAVAGLVVAFAMSIIAIAFLRVRSVTQSEEADYGKPDCSHWCVYRCSWMLGAPVDMEEVAQMLPPRAGGHSLAEIRDALSRIGFDAIGYKESYEMFREGDFPCIVHLKDPDHYVVAAERLRSSILVFDGNGFRQRLKDSSIQKRWTGNVLLVRRTHCGAVLPAFKTRTLVGAPCIEFDTLHVDKGDVPIAKPVASFVFPFCNRGTRPLIIEAVQTDCKCLEVTKPSEPVPPGARGQIVLKYNALAGTERGLFAHEAVIKSNDPVYPILPLRVSGNADARVTVAPRVIDFERIVSGRLAKAYCFVHYSGEDCDSFAVGKCTCSLPNVRIDLVGGDEYQRASRSQSFGKVLTDLSAHVRIIQASITPETNANIGADLSGILEFETSVPDIGRISVPMRLRVVPSVFAIPSFLDFGEVRGLPGAKRAASVKLQSADGLRFRVLRAISERGGQPVQFSAEQRDGTVVAKVVCDEEDALRNHRSKVVFEVQTEDGRKLPSVAVEICAWKCPATVRVHNEIRTPRKNP
jgi:hypothetical protein